MSNTILLIDGSSLAFLHANKPNYKETVKNHIETLLKRYNTTKYLIVLENSKSNFRNKVAVTKEYKGHRRTEKSKQNIQNYLPYLKDVFTEIKNTYIKINNKGKIEATGYYQAYYQIMRGSPKENYLGLKGYGEKKVFNILKKLTSEEEMQQKCIELFKEVYEDEGINKLKEGFKLCWVIQKNNYLITPNIIDYKNINPNFK
jgi:5'-3' exonuclease